MHRMRHFFLLYNVFPFFGRSLIVRISDTKFRIKIIYSVKSGHALDVLNGRQSFMLSVEIDWGEGDGGLIHFSGDCQF